jgi:uncharacterized protein YxjI
MKLNIHQLLEGKSHIFIKQIKEWGEIIFNIENKNRYSLKDDTGTEVGFFYERGDGVFQWIKRLFLRSHRPLLIELVDTQGNVLISLKRSFFWFFSDLYITDNQGQNLGHVHRRFGIIHKRYDLIDQQGETFGNIKAAIWRLWTFKIFNSQGSEIAEISKKWGGVLTEVFTDSDQFGVSFGNVSGDQRVVLLAAAISIDFDFFEDNTRRN